MVANFRPKHDRIIIATAEYSPRNNAKLFARSNPFIYRSSSRVESGMMEKSGFVS